MEIFSTHELNIKFYIKNEKCKSYQQIFAIRHRSLSDTDLILRKHQETKQGTFLSAAVLQDVESHTPEIPLRYNPTGASISLAQ